MEEMKKEEKRGRFGSVLPLGREDFVREVTEGSKVGVSDEGEVQLPDDEEEEDDNEDGEGFGGEGRKAGRSRNRFQGTGVVVFLYKDS